jgi:hypothetical protein
MEPLAEMVVMAVMAVMAAPVERAVVDVSLRLSQVMVARPAAAPPKVVVLTALAAAALVQSMMDVMAVLEALLTLYRGVIAVAAMVVVIVPPVHLALLQWLAGVGVMQMPQEPEVVVVEGGLARGFLKAEAVVEAVGVL